MPPLRVRKTFLGYSKMLDGYNKAIVAMGHFQKKLLTTEMSGGWF